MTSYVTTNLNISTLVYMLETNIQIDPDKLEDIFSNIEPIDYNNPIDFDKLKDLTQEHSLEDLINIYPKMLKGELFGRVVINPNK